MNILKALENLGLNKKEAECYLALLPLRQATAYMVSLRSGLKKSTVYVVLENLVQKGFALKMPSQEKTFYVAKSPKECFLAAKEKMHSAREALPELMAMGNSSIDKPRVYFFEGSAGLDLVDDDILKIGEEILSFTTPQFAIIENEKTHKEYVKKRIAAGIQIRIIGQDSKGVRNLQQKDEKELRQTRILPAELFSSEVKVGVCGNKAFASNYNKKFGLIIEDNDISATLRKIFEIIWESEKIIK
ncbi:MAG: helix-turn-helix domain-containing protein [Candidatus Moraniibacteriota bacterium]